MKSKIILFSVIFLLYNYILIAQSSDNFIWEDGTNHTFFAMEGQGWSGDEISRYSRLPKNDKNQVRDAVWNLSKQSAGLLIRFKSSAPEIKIRYQVKGDYAMSHMPATGVSGLDLYAKDNSGKFLWYRGNYSFKDTIQYYFKNLVSQKKHPNKVREYQLYLPLYNEITWLKIGIPKGNTLESISKRKEKPIVVYGTSIAQGACASRPGMAWTSILERKLDIPLINLGFSGNGRLESELINIINGIDAKIFILDCLPNLILNKERTKQEVYQLIVKSVKNLRAKHEETPILLVDHAGYSDGLTNKSRYKAYLALNEINHKAYQQLKSEGITNLFLLSKAAIDLGMEDFVDGTHPTDLGMMKYALAFEKKIKDIFKPEFD